MKKRFLCLSLIFALTAAQVMPVAAARKDEVQAEKANTQSKLSATESKEAELEEKKNNLLGEIDSLDQNLVQVIAQIDILKGEISDKENAIVETKEDLAEAEADRDEQYAAMKKRIQYLYENGGSDAWAQMLLEVNSITDLLSKAEYTEKMYQFDRDELEKLRDTVQQVTDLGNQLEQEKADMEDLQAEYEDQKSSTEATLAQKKAEQADYDNQLAAARSQAAAYKKQIQDQQKQLKKLEAERKRKEAEAAAAAAAQQKSNSGSASNSSGSTSGSASSSSGASVSGGGSGASIASYALKFVGNPYVSGGTSLTNGADCSGFTWAVYQNFGISIPRQSDAQGHSGKSVSYADAQAGDIIYYGGHVGIYIGGGRIVHASTAKTGIKISSATYRSILSVRRYY